MIWTLIKWCKKKKSHRACLHVRGLLKWGIFTGRRLKIRITFIQSEVLVTGKTQSFILKVKLQLLAYLLSSIASFKLFLISWLRDYYTFSDGSMVSLKSSPWPKYTQLGTIFQKKLCSTINFFSSLDMFFIRPFLATTCKKIGSPCLFKGKENLFRYRANFEGNLLRFVRERANDAKIVRSRDAQCNTKELP